MKEISRLAYSVKSILFRLFIFASEDFGSQLFRDFHGLSTLNVRGASIHRFNLQTLRQ